MIKKKKDNSSSNPIINELPNMKNSKNRRAKKNTTVNEDSHTED
jgi:hypothetical protein